MSINLSSSLNASHPSNLYSAICYSSLVGSLIFCTFAATNFLLLLPLSILVLHVGFQRWRLQQSTSMMRATSHTDIFTYHMVVMEILTLLASGLYGIADFMRKKQIMMSGYLVFSIVLPSQTYFHCLTCVERYLAVVYSITYLGLRKTGGIRIRNISIFCIWLMGFGWMGVTYRHLPYLPIIPFVSQVCLSLLVSSVCSLCVLRVLRHPSPGNKGRDSKRVDQSKQRAFCTIMVIMGVLLLRFVGFLFCMAIYNYIIAKGGDPCVVLKFSFWFNLPSSLVLPLLFLQRAEKVSCCKNITESGEGSE